jgi:DNA-3-methyladenine glycosylase II
MKSKAPKVPKKHVVDEALAHFRLVDQVLYTAALPHVDEIKRGMKHRRAYTELFPALAGSIVSQQLSTKAADAIWARLEKLCGGRVTPEGLLRRRVQTLRNVGLSGAKVKTLQELSRALVEGSLVLPSLARMQEEDAILALTQVWGIGRWTAEMFLIFALNRPDVFSSGDLGLRRSIEKLYSLEQDCAVAILEAHTYPWSPYRSIACRALWRIRDDTSAH